MSSDACDICANTFNKTKRAPVTCMYCQLVACRECCEKYILSVITPKCMNNSCQGEWSRKFMNNSLSKTFVNTKFKQHKENQLFEIEKQLLPITQLIIERDIKHNQLQNKFDNYIEEIDSLRFYKFNPACDDIYKAVYPDVIDNREQIITMLDELNYVDVDLNTDAFCFEFSDFSRLFGITPQLVKYELKMVRHSYTVSCSANPALNSYTSKKNHINALERVNKLKIVFENYIKKIKEEKEKEKEKEKEQEKEKEKEKASTPYLNELCRRITREFETYDIINDSLILLSYEIFNEVRETIAQTRAEMLALESTTSILDNKKQPENYFVKPCTNPTCRGFLNKEWKCGLCNCSTCSECHEFKGETDNNEDTHICDENNVKTAKLLATDTKNCPKCQSSIHKTDGCDQMWCTQCRTAFSWTTGAIEKKIHNPHYYEWMRKNGGLPREPGDVVCGNELNHTLIHVVQAYLNLHRKLPNINKIEFKFSIILQHTLHLSEVERGRFLPRRDNQFEDEKSRYQYLTNQSSLATFKQQLYHRHKMAAKRADTLIIVDLLITTVTDIIFRFIEELKTGSEPTLTILNEVNKIADYANECFKDIGETYSNVPHRIVTDNNGSFLRLL